MIIHKTFMEDKNYKEKTIEQGIDSALVRLEQFLEANNIPEYNILGIKEFQTKGRIGISVFMRMD